MPVYAQFQIFDGLFFCEFDQPLWPGPVGHANWVIRAAARERFFIAPNAGGTVVTGSTVFGAFIGGNRVTYTAAVPDVRGLTGIPADPFVGFPVTVL